METIQITIQLKSGEVVNLELTGAVALQHAASYVVTFTGSGDAFLKVIDIGDRVSHVSSKVKQPDGDTQVS